jgi:ubiquinone/menaquinone biosynthesis C-methylase UbiE
MPKNDKKEIKEKHLKAVKEHYEDYPYPLRDPEEDKTRLLKIQGESLAEINHWLFKGKQNFQSDFRVLIAGGGTGDSTIFLADQLKSTNAEIVYLDFSKASMEVAQKRAAARGLKNIKWINDSILNIPDLALGKFDFIQSSGVLHHLESPPAGLKILQESLTDSGGMALMVYAQIGRTGIYQMQELMRLVNDGASERAEEVENCKKILSVLPTTNWFQKGAGIIADHVSYGDSGIYDLLLHKQDRAYTIPELHEFINNAGLNFVEYTGPIERIALMLENYIRDDEILQRLKKLDIIRQQEFCEIMCGDIIKHNFYVSNQRNSVASFDDLDNVPFVNPHINNGVVAATAYEAITPEMISATVAIELVGDYRPINIKLPVSKYTKCFFKHVVAKNKSLAEIFTNVREEMGISDSDQVLLADFKNTFKLLEKAGGLFLRDKQIPEFPND